MTKLTNSEQLFYNDIIQDEINNGELSIFSVLFYGTHLRRGKEENV